MKAKIIIIFLFCFSTIGCKNVEFAGKASGGERGMVNEFNISTNLSERYRFKSRISKPYDYDNIDIPIYTENSIEILF